MFSSFLQRTQQSMVSIRPSMGAFVILTYMSRLIFKHDSNLSGSFFLPQPRTDPEQEAKGSPQL